MNCSEVQQVLSAYYDGELLEDVRTPVSDHLDGCSDCEQRLAGFEKLSAMTNALPTPSPSAQIWRQLERELDNERITPAVGHERRRPFSVSKVMALAVTVVIVVAMGWVAYESRVEHDEHSSFVVEFGQFVDQFHSDPDVAQENLLTKYRAREVDTREATQQLGYRPAVADGLPEQYTVQSTYVMDMPCCRCVQCECKRSDGSAVVIFEHDDEDLEWIGDRPSSEVMCNGKPCSLVEVGDRIAATWNLGQRYITVIGARDVDEIDQLVAWLDKKRKPEQLP